MAKECGRSPSVRDYSKFKRKRRLEVLGFIMSTMLLVFLIGFYLVCKRIKSLESVRNICVENSTHHQVNITEAFSSRKFPNGSVLGDNTIFYHPWAYWVSDTGDAWGCPCLLKPCIYKCCDHGQAQTVEYFINEYGESERDVSCTNTNASFTPEDKVIYTKGLQQVKVDKYHFYMIAKSLPCDISYPLEEEEIKQTYLSVDGILHKYSDNDIFIHYNYSQFCVDSMVHNSSMLSVKVCSEFNMEESESSPTIWVYKIKSIAFIISVPFLIITALVYILLPPLQNLHGKSLVCHVTSLATAYFCLGLVNVMTLSRSVCTLVGKFQVISSNMKCIIEISVVTVFSISKLANVEVFILFKKLKYYLFNEISFNDNFEIYLFKI